MVVGGQGTAGFKQFGHSQSRRNRNALRVDVLPDFIEVHQPVEKLGILHGFEVSRQSLVEVMMGIDKTRDDGATGAVDCPVGPDIEVGPHGFYRIALDQQIRPALDFPVRVGHQGENVL